MFELVEQVLSLLVAQHSQHQHMLNKSAANSPVAHGHTRPWVPINHIRDQLIAPQDRKRKKRIWDKVVKYIRESGINL